MTKECYLNELKKLEITHEKHIKEDLSNLMWENIKGYPDLDWTEAVKQFMDDPTQRTFPRIGAIKKALAEASGRRVETVAFHRRIIERREVDELMASNIGDTIRGDNKARAKAIIQALSLPMPNERKIALSSLTDAWSNEENKIKDFT